MTMSRLNSFELRVQEASDANDEDPELSRIGEYLDLLQKQAETPLSERSWGAFRRAISNIRELRAHS